MKHRLLAAILSLSLMASLLVSPALAQGPESSPTGNAAVNQTTQVEYPTLSAAVEAAQDGQTIQLLRDEVVSGAGKGKNQAAVTITADIVLDGAGHTITTDGFELDGSGNPQTHVITVQEGAQVTIRDLAIEGSASTKHGINVWAAGAGDAVTLTLEDVAIRNCGTAGMVVNHSSVTANGLTTSGNVWGAVNVDNSGSFTLTGTENQMEEAVKLWTEKPDGAGAVTIDVSDSNLKPVKGEGANLKGYTYYTDDVSQLGEGYNQTTQTVYEDLDAAVAAVAAGHTLRVVRSAALDTAAVLPAGATLSVEEGVVLTTNDQLSGEGNIVNNGAITGQVTPTEPAGADDYRVTYLVDGQIWFTQVLTQSGGQLTFVQPSDPAKAGHTFAGWDYGSNVSVSGGAVTLTVGADKTYTFNAQWTPIPVPPATYPVTVSPSDHGQVTADPQQAAQGATVTLTVTAEEGYELDTLAAAGQDGAPVALTAQEDGTHTFSMPASPVTVTATFAPVAEEPEEKPELPFADVAEDTWYYDSVYYVWDQGLMQGVGGGSFAPADPATRAMLMTVLARLKGADLEGGATWYEKAVAWAVDQGVSDGSAPLDNITREQIVTMLYRCAGASPVGEDHLSAFADAGQVSGWAKDAMNWAVSTGLLKGRDGSLAPAGAAPRLELAAFLARFAEMEGA